MRLEEQKLERDRAYREHEATWKWVEYITGLGSEVSITNSILFTSNSTIPTWCSQTQSYDWLNALADWTLIGQIFLHSKHWMSEDRKDPVSDQARKSAKETICMAWWCGGDW